MVSQTTRLGKGSSVIVWDKCISWRFYYDVMLDSYLGKISDYFHHHNKNNQLKRQV